VDPDASHRWLAILLGSNPAKFAEMPRDYDAVERLNNPAEMPRDYDAVERLNNPRSARYRVR